MLLKFLNSQMKRNFAFPKTVLYVIDLGRELCPIFSFFHFLCNLRRLEFQQTFCQLPKMKFSIICIVFFINFCYIWFYFMLECKLCKKILNILYLNDYFNSIIQFQSLKVFTLAPVETQMLPSEERRHKNVVRRR